MNSQIKEVGVAKAAPFHMTREEFYKWLNTCPAHDWEVWFESLDYVKVTFHVYPETEEAAERAAENKAAENKAAESQSI